MSLLKWWKESGERRRSTADFLEHLKAVTADGVLSDDERYFILEHPEMVNGSAAWVKAAPSIFLAAVRGASGGGPLSPNQERELRSIADFMRLTKAEAAQGLAEIAKRRADFDAAQVAHEEERRIAKAQMDFVARREAELRNLREGLTAPVDAPGILLLPLEQAIWVEPATLLEQRVVRRERDAYGNSVSVRDWRPTAEGELIVTNFRLLFRGDAKSLADNIGAVFGFEFTQNGMQYSVTRSQKTRFLGFPNRNGEFVAAAVESVVNAKRVPL